MRLFLIVVVALLACPSSNVFAQTMTPCQCTCPSPVVLAQPVMSEFPVQFQIRPQVEFVAQPTSTRVANPIAMRGQVCPDKFLGQVGSYYMYSKIDCGNSQVVSGYFLYGTTVATGCNGNNACRTAVAPIFETDF